MAAGSGYIVVPNWKEFQHYHDRTPPWIKLHVDLMGNNEWLELTPADRVLLLGIWILVSRYGNGRVRADSGWLCSQLEIRKGSVERLVQAGFVKVRASKALAPRYQTASAEGSKEPKRQKRARGASTSPARPPRVQEETASTNGHEPERDDDLNRRSVAALKANILKAVP